MVKPLLLLLLCLSLSWTNANAKIVSSSRTATSGGRGQPNKSLQAFSNSKLTKLDLSNDFAAEIVQKAQQKAQQQPQQHHQQHRRSSAPSNQTYPVAHIQILSDIFPAGLLHWVGNGCKIALFLTYQTNSGQYDLYRTLDYSISNWTKVNQLFGGAPIFTFAPSPINTSIVFFLATNSKVLYISHDAGATVTAHNIPFVPAALEFSPYMSNYVIALENPSQNIYVSTDTGVTWNVLSAGGSPLRKSAIYWGSSTEDCDLLYMQDSSGNIYQFRLGSPNTPTLLSGQLSGLIFGSFVLTNEYMYVQAVTNLDYFIYVSLNRGPFTRAVFPFTQAPQEFSFVAAAEHMALVTVQHNVTTSNMYESTRRGVDFSLSLDNILYVSDPNIGFFPEFSYVAGLEGIYMATQLTPDANEYYQTVVSFNKGGDWDRLVPPTDDLSTCDYPDCALNLHMAFSSSRHTYNIPSVYTNPSAPGYILANGNVGANLQTQGNTYFSDDAGLTWTQARTGFSQFHMLDSAGVLLLGPQTQTTLCSSIEYSIDDGQTWNTYTLPTPIYVVGMVSEPGQTSTVVSLVGVEPHAVSWAFISIDFSPLFPRQCNSSDYFYWSPRDEIPELSCTLGQNTRIIRRDPDAVCLNGYGFVRNTTGTVCECTGDDFECDTGFSRPSLRSPCAPIAGIPLTLNCTSPGQIVSISRGYSLIADDVCVGGITDFERPISYVCPTYIPPPTTTTTPGSTTTTKTSPTPITSTTTTKTTITSTTTTTTTTTSKGEPSHGDDSSSHSALIAGFVVALIALLAGSIIIIVVLLRRLKRGQANAVRYAPLSTVSDSAPLNGDHERDERDDDMLAY